MRTALATAWGAALFGGSVLARSLRVGVPRVSAAERRAAMPKTAPLAGPLSIRWDERQVPFVEAGNERDLAVGFGIVHAHLRLAQLELMRRAARGRLSEAIGPAAIEIDRLLRLLDFPRVAAPSLALMPAATRAFVGGFADGINAVIATGRTPPDLAIAGIRPESWTETDVFAVSRLASADYTWKVWRAIRHLRDRPDWPEVWAALVGRAGAADEDLPPARAPAADAVATAFARNGSNAIAVSARRSATGAALLACDPHLPVATPGIWFAVGLRSPGLAAVGLAIPGLPILGVGRNARVAWGGTNLHAASSELVDVSAPDEPVDTRTEELPVRWRSAPLRLALRESRFGPVVGDHPAFRIGRNGRAVALRWLGHVPSDEFTPFLDIARARCWADVRSACERYALPGLNMLCADGDGRIGSKIAARVPRRPRRAPRDLVLQPAEADAYWAEFVSGDRLPERVDPAEGVLVSANEEPDAADPPVGFFFSAGDRAERLAALAAARGRIGPDDLAAFQRDVRQASALAVRDRLLAALDGAGSAADPVVAAIRAWDGDYRADSAGALAFELVVAGLLPRLERHLPGARPTRSWQPLARVADRVDAASPALLAAAAVRAVRDARRPFRRHGTWGGLHRIRLVHPLARIPWLARRAPPVDMPAAGANETLLKTQHAFTWRRHATHFGQNARFVADLADPDGTHFVLLGGQDGWFGGPAMTDQAEAWRGGRAFRLPLSGPAVAAAFPHVTTVRPAAAQAADPPGAADATRAAEREGSGP